MAPGHVVGSDLELAVSARTGLDDAAIDPFTFSVILHRLTAIVDEMTRVLEHSAYTPILALCRDFSCAIYDATPRQLSMGDALPIHTTSLVLVIEAIADTFGEDIHPGDVFICNDSYSGNTHVGDLVTACPVFLADDHFFWAVARGHQADTGAFVASSATAATRNVWQEGLAIPPIKLRDSGKERRDVLELYLRNVRYRDLLLGDLLAQLGAIEKGRLRLEELGAEFGLAAIPKYIDAIVDYADRRMTEEMRSMPDGEYRAVGWIDSDGHDALHIPIHVTVKIEREDITVDFTGSGSQVVGGINGSYGAAVAAGGSPILYCIAPDIPRNHGCHRHIRVVAPEGTVCNARFPAATHAATVIPSDAMQDTVSKALAQAIPDRVIAGTARGAQNVITLAAETSKTGEQWGLLVFNGSGGSGAARGADGWPIFDSVAAFGGMRVAPIEQMDWLNPLLFEQCEIEPESMGFGTWLGGPGTRLRIRPLQDGVECDTLGDGCLNPPHGVCGGTGGFGGGQFVEHNDSGRRRFFSPIARFRLSREEVWCGVSSGGGGYGPPTERDAEQVRKDVRDGIVSIETARNVFGVVISADPDRSIEWAETTALREELRKQSQPLLSPRERGAGTWAQTQMRPDDVYVLNPQEV